MRRVRVTRRSGAETVEAAIVFPVAFFFVIAIAVGAMGIFRYHQVCYLAREATRYASTHGGQYQQENMSAIQSNTLPNVDESYLKTNIIAANTSNLDPTNLSTAINFNTSSGSYGWDDIANNGNRWPTSSKTVNGTTFTDINTVSVTITYTWMPEIYLFGPITLTSTSVMPMCY